MSYATISAVSLSLMSFPAIAQTVSAISVNEVAVLEARGAGITVTGNVSCTAGIQAEICIGVQQRSGKDFISGGGCSQFVCQGGSQSWRILASAYSRPFKKGPVIGNVNVYTCDLYRCTSTNFSSTFTIR